MRVRHYFRRPKEALYKLRKLYSEARFAAVLQHASGIIHVGANTGQERDIYGNKRVLWIEPIPNFFAQLKDNIALYPSQRALNYLVTETDDESEIMHVASNDGASSSLLELADHKKIWPDIDYVVEIPMRGQTLPTILLQEGEDVSDYDALVLDTQGTELSILRGAEPIIRNFEWVQVEAADFEAYTGCAREDQITSFMGCYGFSEWARRSIISRGVGSYFEIAYRRQRTLKRSLLF